MHSPDWQTSKRTIISAVNRDCEEEVGPHTLLPGIGMEQNPGSKQAMPINILNTETSNSPSVTPSQGS